MADVAVDVRLLEGSGIGTYIAQVLPRVIRARPGWAFTLLGDPERIARSPLAGLPNVEVVPFRAPLYSLRQQWEMPRLIPRRSGLLWVPHFDIPLFHPGPLLVTVHDVFHLASPFSGPAGRWYARAMFRRIDRKASAVIAVSRFTRDGILRHVRGLEGRTEVIPQGVDGDWPPKGLERPHPRPYLLHVGNIKPHKNLSRLVEAFGTLVGRIPHDLVLVGRREGLRKIDRRVEGLAQKLGPRVCFTGWIPQERLRAFYVHAEALLFPSLYEGFGLPPLEAMACGVPTVVSRAAAIPETCGDASQYFDPEDPRDMADKVLEVLESRSLRSELIRKGEARVKRFTWEACAEATLRVIERAGG